MYFRPLKKAYLNGEIQDSHRNHDDKEKGRGIANDDEGADDRRDAQHVVHDPTRQLKIGTTGTNERRDGKNVTHHSARQLN